MDPQHSPQCTENNSRHSCVLESWFSCCSYSITGERIKADNGSDRELRGKRDQSPDEKLHRSRSRSREEPERLEGKEKKGTGHKDRDASSRSKHKREKTKKKHRRSNL